MHQPDVHGRQAVAVEVDVDTPKVAQPRPRLAVDEPPDRHLVSVDGEGADGAAGFHEVDEEARIQKQPSWAMSETATKRSWHPHPQPSRLTPATSTMARSARLDSGETLALLRWTTALSAKGACSSARASSAVLMTTDVARAPPTVSCQQWSGIIARRCQPPLHVEDRRCRSSGSASSTLSSAAASSPGVSRGSIAARVVMMCWCRFRASACLNEPHLRRRTMRTRTERACAMFRSDGRRVRRRQWRVRSGRYSARVPHQSGVQCASCGWAGRSAWPGPKRRPVIPARRVYSAWSLPAGWFRAVVVSSGCRR